MKKLTTVIWDFNGTLVDDASICLEATNQMLLQRGLPPVEMEQYQRLFRFPVIDYYRDIGFAVDGGGYDALADEFLELYRENCGNCRLQPGVAQALELLRQAGVRQIVLSASQRDILVEQLDTLEILYYFSQVLGVDNARAGGKEAMALQWAEDSGLDRAGALLVGDTTHDAEVASAIGIDCLLIPSGHHDAPRLAATGVQVISSPELLVPTFQGYFFRL